MNRRVFLAQAAAAATLSGKGKKIPVGLELYSVRQELTKDDVGTVKAVAKCSTAKVRVLIRGRGFMGSFHRQHGLLCMP